MQLRVLYLKKKNFSLFHHFMQTVTVDSLHKILLVSGIVLNYSSYSDQ